MSTVNELLEIAKAESANFLLGEVSVAIAFWHLVSQLY